MPKVHDEPAGFGDGDEFGGADKAELGAFPAHQCLCPDQGLVGQAILWLV